MGSRSAPGCSSRIAAYRADRRASRSGPTPERSALTTGVRRGPRPGEGADVVFGLVGVFAAAFVAGVGVGFGVAVAIQARIPSVEASSAESGLGFGSFVPRSRAIRAQDRLLVALPGEQHDVTRPRPLDGRLDGVASIGDDEQVVAASLAGRFGPARDVIEDRLAMLAARVLVGDDDDPGTLAGDPAHLGALGRISLTRRPEDRDHSPTTRRGQRREEVEDGLQRGRAVREIDDDAERLAEVDALHPPRDDRQRREALADGGGIEPGSLAERNDG